MSIAAVAALSLLSGLLPSHKAQTSTLQYWTPAWRVIVQTDRFTGGVTCKLYQGSWSDRSVSYAQRSVAFHFNPKLNTQQAWYRLDGGPVLAWSDVYPRLVQIGASLEGKSLDNPTSGLVLLPASDLMGVHTVTIRINPHTSPRTFEIDGLSDALASAQARGCNPATGFER